MRTDRPTGGIDVWTIKVSTLATAVIMISLPELDGHEIGA